MRRDRPFAQNPASPSISPTHAKAGSLSPGIAHYHRMGNSYGMCNLPGDVRIALARNAYLDFIKTGTVTCLVAAPRDIAIGGSTTILSVMLSMEVHTYEKEVAAQARP
jgi:hypothetical protein